MTDGPSRATISPEQWQRIEDIFARVVDREDWTSEVHAMAAGDAELERQVRRLVRACRKERSEQEAAARATQSNRLAGKQLGRWSLDRVIGHGGMGAVYLSHRADGEYEQRVAIKLMAFALQSPYLVERFRQERAALARLNHPNIARLLDGGVTEEGEPFLVLEYVDGRPLMQYCRETNPSTPERIRIFQQICRAVQFAHQNLIIHCDLKPGNVLVDQSGVPKLLDFGTARLLAEGQTSAVTGTGLITPGYASPEQMRGEPVSTLSDVYSLGAILFELLSGQRAFPKAPAVLYQPEQIPMAPSAAAAAAGEPTLASALRRDLDNIVLHAMAPEPERRYGSAEELAGDLERYLRGEPVTARPRKWTYVAGRFVARNRGVCALAAALALTLAVGVGINLQRNRAARVEAQKSAALASLASSILGELSSEESPAVRRMSDEERSALLEKFHAQLSSALDAAPELKARLLNTLAASFGAAHQPGEALVLLEQAATLLEADKNRDPYLLVQIYIALCGTLTGRGEFAEVARRANQAEALLEGTPKDHPLRLGLLERLGMSMFVAGGDRSEIRRTLTAAVDGCRARYGERSLPAASALTTLARAQITFGELDEAERNLAAAAAVFRDVPGGRLALSVALTLRGIIERIRGRLPEAGKMLLEAGNLVDGMDSGSRMPVVLELARVDALSGRTAQAIPVLRGCLQDSRRIQFPWETAYTLTALGQALTLAGKPADAEPVLREGLAIRRRTLPPGHVWTLDTEGELGAALLARRECPESKQLLEESRRELAADLGPAHPYVTSQEHRLAEWQRVCGR